MAHIFVSYSFIQQIQINTTVSLERCLILPDEYKCSIYSVHQPVRNIGLALGPLMV